MARYGSVLEHLGIRTLAQTEITRTEELGGRLPALDSDQDVLVEIVVREKAGPTHYC